MVPVLTSEPVPIGMAFVGGPILLALGGMVAYVGVIALRGELPRNGRLGIRTATTLASDDAWLTGHRAAGPWIIGAALGAIVPGGVVLFRPANDTFTLLTMVGLGLMVALVAIASLAANTAAESPELSSMTHGQQISDRHDEPAPDAKSG